ncbi:hypothetical protein Zmor_008405 [Zophobas morio]|uniref:HMG box domain-containing protein n=1 Tax=Zophobas morio TaxID=2755281 RepID=A0AA38MMZ1_9CUCU|nr:hypothetical protein Zmor_008405 [Zophobas morio]
MGWPKENGMNPDFEENRNEFSRNFRRSRTHSVDRGLKSELKDVKNNPISRNPFINFLTEFKKITPTLKMSCAQLAKIGGEMWRDMTDKQRSQFQIVDAKRRRKGKKGGRRRRRGKHHSITPFREGP